MTFTYYHDEAYHDIYLQKVDDFTQDVFFL